VRREGCERNLLQAPFVRGEDRHQERQEKERNVGLEVTGANGVGVDGGEIAKYLISRWICSSSIGFARCEPTATASTSEMLTA
jgi:hypothetical protein